MEDLIAVSVDVFSPDPSSNAYTVANGCGVTAVLLERVTGLDTGPDEEGLAVEVVGRDRGDLHGGGELCRGAQSVQSAYYSEVMRCTYS